MFFSVTSRLASLSSLAIFFRLEEGLPVLEKFSEDEFLTGSAKAPGLKNVSSPCRAGNLTFEIDSLCLYSILSRKFFLKFGTGLTPLKKIPKSQKSVPIPGSRYNCSYGTIIMGSFSKIVRAFSCRFYRLRSMSGFDMYAGFSSS